MPRTHGTTNHLIPHIRKHNPPILQFRVPRKNNHPPKRPFRYLPNPRPLDLTIPISSQDLGEGVDKIILRRHEHHLLHPTRSQCFRRMNESRRYNFLSAVGGRNEILFSPMREAGERCTVQKRGIKPSMEPPIVSFIHRIHRAMDDNRRTLGPERALSTQ